MVRVFSVATLIAPACALFMMAQPAIAAERGATASQSEPKTAAAKHADDGRKYCIKLEALTGSRLAKRACKTKQEWALEGVDVAAKN